MRDPHFWTDDPATNGLRCVACNATTLLSALPTNTTSCPGSAAVATAANTTPTGSVGTVINGHSVFHNTGATLYACHHCTTLNASMAGFSTSTCLGTSGVAPTAFLAGAAPALLFNIPSTGFNLYDPSEENTPPLGTPTRDPDARPMCPRCDREWSEYLDAYHGNNPALAELCSPCRSGRAS